ncbi:hypothetical protein LTR37_006333 [Vermiconidia calcicola]|uniref:Uncharacterized protein n=1 Tax=Vermiconidia calcicola TaxID=1690605 RepID=A0ACC3NHC3_9PEZI|nr:hypothetical protein LTR37_006333 [Vermiconidia calcicola]
MHGLTLHEDRVSGNAYKVRLIASLLNITIHEFFQYEISKGETRTSDFLSKINANGRIPVLQVGPDRYLPESNAACYYLATDSRLMPSDPWKHAQMLQWMFFEQSFVEPTIGTLRYWFKRTGEDNFSQEQQVVSPSKRESAEAALQVMDAHLATRDFFVDEEMTLADAVLYAYVHLAPEAGLDLACWTNLHAWCRRISSQSGFVSMDYPEADAT